MESRFKSLWPGIRSSFSEKEVHHIGFVMLCYVAYFYFYWGVQLNIVFSVTYIIWNYAILNYVLYISFFCQ